MGGPNAGGASLENAHYQELEALRSDKAAAHDELLMLGILEVSMLCRACVHSGAPPMCSMHWRVA